MSLGAGGILAAKNDVNSLAVYSVYVKENNIVNILNTFQN